MPSSPMLTSDQLHHRREMVFLLLSGIFLGTLAMLNILGITRFIKLYSMVIGQGTADQWELVFAVAVGVLPYPVTFLCTDLISELYGKARANAVVWVGLVLNLWVVLILWIGGLGVGMGEEDVIRNGALIKDAAGRLPLYFEIQGKAFGAVAASMIAYLAAQFCDVYVFHFWKRLTKGKHLWLRNNGSTMVSQIVDTVAVILITYYFTQGSLPMNDTQSVAFQLIVTYIAAGYAFKFVVALLDTIPIYIAVHYLGKYLQIDPTKV